MMNKNNVPYYIAGTLATFTLLASGVFAAAPYIGFLAPVAALSVGLPFIIGGAVFSAVAIVLSCKAISKNKTISEKVKEIEGKDKTIFEKEVQLADEKSKVEAKDKIISEKEATVQAQKQTISELEAKIQTQKQTISGQNDQLTEKDAVVQTQKQTISEQKTQLAKKNKKIEEDKLKVAIADGTVQLAKGTVNGAVWFAKGAVNGVLYSGKYVKRGLEEFKPYIACKEVVTTVKEAYNSGRIPSIIQRRRSDVVNDLKNVVGSMKNACGTSINSVIPILIIRRTNRRHCRVV
ncbi:hypothetical protein [Wolbachia endosymbiont of Oedothorax gibbosus]|uniref:hypothetical protein n=1 Tax=Wolbachia endosymbiont of Oedothorax gibbosus TaxID=931100 RepID=UPI00202403CB|nr:hypothetical protein [Wolbachia endosymbiont of Oedothorax gibbosus]